MKLNKTGINVDKKELFTGNSNEEIEMAINLKGQAHIMNLLTDLYEDPIEATIRETMSNAIDAVVENGSGEVYVEAPSKMTPYLIIKDTGVGMDYDTIQNIYSLYGASTKAEDFEQIGAFGLGAKAPLSYCSEFTVSTVKDGRLIELALTKSIESNKIEIYNNEETDEPNGTTVTIPVKEDDIEAFKSVLNLYKSTPTLPVDIYIDGVKIEDNENYVVIEQDFLLDEETNTTGKIWVTKRGVKALVSSGRTSDSWSNSMAVDFLLSGWMYHPYDESNVVVELKPGILNFSSSRDEVTKDERYRLFKKRIDNYIPELQKKLIKELGRNTYKENEDIILSMGDIRYTPIEKITLGLGTKLTVPYYSSSSDIKDEIVKLESSDGISLDNILNKGDQNTYGTYSCKSSYGGAPRQYLGQVRFEEQISIENMISTFALRIKRQVKYNINLHFIDEAPSLVIGNINEETLDTFKKRRKYIQDNYNTRKVVLTEMSAKKAEASVYEGMKKDANTIYLNIEDIQPEEPKKNKAKRKKREQPVLRGRLISFNLEENIEEDYYKVDTLIRRNIHIVIYSTPFDYHSVANGIVNEFFSESEYNEMRSKSLFIISEHESRRLMASDIKKLHDNDLIFYDKTNYRNFRKSAAIMDVIKTRSFQGSKFNKYEKGLYEKGVKARSIKHFDGLKNVIAVGQDEDYEVPSEYFDYKYIHKLPFDIKSKDIIKFTPEEELFIKDTIEDFYTYCDLRYKTTKLSKNFTRDYETDANRVREILITKGYKI